MGLFNKKSDPISERAKALAQEIAALEAQIKKLATQEKKADQERKLAPPEPPVPAPATSAIPRAAPPHSSQPRLRSTALPHHRQPAPVQPPPPPASHEPIFEDMDQERIQSESEQPAPEREEDIGVRKSNLATAWQRFKNHFRGPATSNPKLVNYLAAGSIQGLRPLRYERRVARNRFIFFVLILVAALWGLIFFFYKHR
jgi:hypothetical protein